MSNDNEKIFELVTEAKKTKNPWRQRVSGMFDRSKLGNVPFYTITKIIRQLQAEKGDSADLDDITDDDIMKAAKSVQNQSRQKIELQTPAAIAKPVAHQDINIQDIQQKYSNEPFRKEGEQKDILGNGDIIHRYEAQDDRRKLMLFTYDDHGKHVFISDVPSDNIAQFTAVDLENDKIIEDYFNERSIGAKGENPEDEETIYQNANYQTGVTDRESIAGGSEDEEGAGQNMQRPMRKPMPQTRPGEDEEADIFEMLPNIKIMKHFAEPEMPITNTVNTIDGQETDDDYIALTVSMSDDAGNEYDVEVEVHKDEIWNWIKTGEGNLGEISVNSTMDDEEDEEHSEPEGEYSHTYESISYTKAHNGLLVEDTRKERPAPPARRKEPVMPSKGERERLLHEAAMKRKRDLYRQEYSDLGILNKYY